MQNNPNPDTFAQRLEHFKTLLKQAGIKQTHQRIEIFREVVQTDQHPDAETVYQGVRVRIPTVSLDTVYRTLLLFSELGIIANVKGPHERMRFDANMHTHHHFVCVKCGMIRDFTSPVFDALTAPDVVQTFGTTANVHVECRGICWNCMEKAHDQSSC